ncbi:GntR family transcriptional regulator [Nocardia sp. CWNU-33]|uniref:GntR family transcriptional regulator n=1 Tax=Nocardia sp. CWNU-33 TaxID=3392117 RepID=UPI00398EA78B
MDALAADHIRARILDGRLEPGAHLVEADIAEELGVSAGTVRAALRLLRNEGLVEHRRNRGIYVETMTVEDAWEIYSLRNTLEGMAARLAAQRIDIKGRSKLERALHTMQEAAQHADTRTLANADVQLHELIVELAGHSRLQAAHRVIHAQTVLFMAMTKDFHGDTGSLLNAHEQLVDAISRGDADRAEELARSHSTEDGERLRNKLSLNHSLKAI